MVLREGDPGDRVKHLEWLLKHKTHFSYDDKYVDVQDL
jgi:hypothetical protein